MPRQWCGARYALEDPSMVNVQAEGLMAPCAQGATLTLPEWHALRAALPDLCSALDRRSLSHAAGLGARRRVSLCEHSPGVAGMFLPEASPGGPRGGDVDAALEGIQLPAATVKVCPRTRRPCMPLGAPGPTHHTRSSPRPDHSLR